MADTASAHVSTHEYAQIRWSQQTVNNLRAESDESAQIAPKFPEY